MGIKLSQVLGAAAGRVSKNIDLERKRLHEEMTAEKTEDSYRARQDYQYELDTKKERAKENKTLEERTKALNYYGVPQEIQAQILSSNASYEDAIAVAKLGRKNGVPTSQLYSVVPNSADRKAIVGSANEEGEKYALNLDMWKELNASPDAKVTSLSQLSAVKLNQQFKHKAGSPEYIRLANEIKTINEQRSLATKATTLEVDPVTQSEERQAWKASMIEGTSFAGFGYTMGELSEALSDDDVLNYSGGILRSVSIYDGKFGNLDSDNVKTRVEDQTSRVSSDIIRKLNSKEVTPQQASGQDSNVSLVPKGILTGKSQLEIIKAVKANQYQAGSTLYDSQGVPYYFSGVPLYVTLPDGKSFLTPLISNRSDLSYSYYNPQGNN